MTGRRPSRRWVDVLQLVASGYTNEQAAEALGVSADTVKTHLQRTFAHLGARDRAHAVVLALQAGWLILKDTGQARAPVRASTPHTVVQADWDVS